MFDKNKQAKQPYYDEYDAVNFIVSETGMKKSIIRAILNSEMRYMHSVGIIEDDDLEGYISECNSDPEFKD